MGSSSQLVGALVDWARGNLPRLRHEPASLVAEQLGDAVLRVDSRLGVEVADDDPGDREVIVTAFSDPSVFLLVRDITHQLSDIPGWRFVALKPPRGFSFKLSVGNQRVDASSLSFAPIPEIAGGIQLLTPSQEAGAAYQRAHGEELAWLVVEAGIGEELAGLLQHVDFASAASEEKRYPISELEAFVRANLRSGAVD